MSETKSIQLKITKMRKRPSFLSDVVKKLKYADKVECITTRGAWTQVEISGVNGWVHNSAITDKEIVLKSGRQDTSKSISEDERLLAGKGYSASVEKEMQAENPNSNFTEIDRIESIEISPQKLKAFIKEGGLKG